MAVLPSFDFSDDAKKFAAAFFKNDEGIILTEALKVLMPEHNSDAESTLVAFKTLPLKDKNLTAIVTAERLTEFVNEHYFNEVNKLDFETMLTDPNIVFAILLKHPQQLAAVSAFVPSEAGHYCVLIVVRPDHRGKSLGK